MQLLKNGDASEFVECQLYLVVDAKPLFNAKHVTRPSYSGGTPESRSYSQTIAHLS